MKIVILGSGFVGTAYKTYLESIGHEPLVVSRSFCYYPYVAVIRSLLEHYRPHYVIGAMGFCGLTVDCLESKRSECIDANVRLPVNVAAECHKLSIPYVHMSSGCIYDGKTKTFTEDDKPNPPSHYARCKHLAEINIAQFNPFVFRIRMPFSARNHPRNWLVKISRYPQILDGFNSVTWLEEFCERSWRIVEKGSPPQSPAVYNSVQPGAVYTRDIAQLLLDAGVRVLPVSLFDQDEFYKTHVKRSEAVLDCSKFDSAYGKPGTPALAAIKHCVDQLLRN